MRNPTITEFLDCHSQRLHVAKSQLLMVVGHLTPETELTWAQFLEASLRLYLMHTQVRSSVEIMMKVAAERIHAHADYLAALDEQLDDITEIPLQIQRIGISDDTWFVVNGIEAFFHLHSGDKIKGLTTAPIKTVSFDVTALWFRAREDLEKYREGKQDANPVEAATAEVRHAQSETPG